VECTVCPFECGIDRSRRLGVCRASDRIEISIAQFHLGEEPPISGTHGSGAIFFAHCNLRCRFCQNYEISQLGHGHPVSNERLIEITLELQKRGAHNINLVSPTHYSEQLIPILRKVRPKLRIPVVWNSNAYEKVETIRRLEGMVQIYLPDLKYHSDQLAKDCSSAPNYFYYATKAITEMVRQVGQNQYNPDRTLKSGIIIRHLVLPGHTSDSKRILDWLAEKLGTDIQISLMAQYYPVYRAAELPGMNRRLFRNEYEDVKQYFLKLGFKQGFIQDLSSASSNYTPNFDQPGI